MAGPGLASGSAVQGALRVWPGPETRSPLASYWATNTRLQEDFTMPRRVAPAHRSILAPLALIPLAACGPDVTLDAGEELHPTSENAPPPDAALITTGSEPIGLSAEALTEWRAARDRLLGARTTLALGTSRGESPELFGMIGDVAFDRDGNVLVLDAANYDVRIFGPDGSHLMSFGREGEGPMEFNSRPHSVAGLADGRLLVGMRAAIKIFAPVAGEYEYVDLIAVPARHMCVSAAERVFVTVHHTRSSDRVLHEVDVAGDSTAQSFGHGYLDEHWLFRNQLSDGTIACLDDPARILFAFSEHAILRMHRAGEDDPIWTAVLEDYVQPFYAGAIDGSSIRMVSDNAEFVDKPHVLGGSHIVVQAGYRRLLSLRIRTYLVDAATGQGALVSEDLPRIMKMVPGRFVAGWNDPYPRIEVRELAGN